MLKCNIEKVTLLNTVAGSTNKGNIIVMKCVREEREVNVCFIFCSDDTTVYSRNRK